MGTIVAVGAGGSFTAVAGIIGEEAESAARATGCRASEGTGLTVGSVAVSSGFFFFRIPGEIYAAGATDTGHSQ